MTVYEVKRRHEEMHPSSYFFSRNSMAFFHQRLRDFSARKMANGIYRVACPMCDYTGRMVGETIRIFNYETGSLEMEGVE